MTMSERPDPLNGHVDMGSRAVALERMLCFESMRAAVRTQVAAIAADPRTASARRLLLTGTGDGLFAALSVQPALARWTGLRVQALTAMEFARYEVPVVAPGDLLVSISDTGACARSREAVALAKSVGIPTIAVTGTGTGPLAQEADLALCRPICGVEGMPAGNIRGIPDMAGQIAALYALYALGLALGEAHGRVPAEVGQMWRQRLDNVIGQLTPTVTAIESEARRIAAAIGCTDTIWYLGAGPGFGSARYSAALFNRQTPINGVAEDLEEWAHQQYFLTSAWGSRALVVVLAPPGNALDRAQEIVTGIRSAGGRAAVVTAPGIDGFDDAEFRFDVPDVGTEWLSPMLFQLPAWLLSLHLGQLGRAGVATLKCKDGGWLTRHSQAQMTLDGLQ